MIERFPFRYFKTSPKIIRLAFMLYVRFPLLLSDIEEPLNEHGWVRPACKTEQPNSFKYEPRDYPKTKTKTHRAAPAHGNTRSACSPSLRGVLPIAAITLIKAWIPFCANKWWAGINVKKPYLQQHVCGSQYNRGQKNPAYYSQHRRSEHCTIRIWVEVS